MDLTLLMKTKKKKIQLLYPYIAIAWMDPEHCVCGIPICPCTINIAVFLQIYRAQWCRPGDGAGRCPGLPGLSFCSAVQPRGPSEGCSAPQPLSPHHCLRTCDGVQLYGPSWHWCHIKGKDTLLCRWPMGLPLSCHKNSLAIGFKIFWRYCHTTFSKWFLKMGLVCLDVSSLSHFFSRFSLSRACGPLQLTLLKCKITEIPHWPM